MAAELIPSPSSRRGSPWAGRASRHRRQQVGARASDPVVRVQSHWESLVEVLRGMDTPSSALLCTADGVPVPAYGLPKADLPRASLDAGTVFAARTSRIRSGHAAVPGTVQTVEVTADRRHTVIASVGGSQRVDHLLSVTAEGVSPPLLHAWTRRTAEELAELLHDQS